MHEWERQDKLLERVEKQDVKNCLNYEKFSYSKNEWDNIPGIVPRFTIYMSKYIEGLSGVCAEFHARETVASIRTFSEDQFKNTNAHLDSFKKDEDQRKKEINKRITDLSTYTEGFKEEYKNFTHQATMLSESECKNTLKHCMEVVIESRGKKEDHEDQPNNALKAKRGQMRMYSFKQLFNIFSTYSNKSEVQDRVCTIEDQVKDIYNQLKQ